jgi:hypothetical protein
MRFLQIFFKGFCKSFFFFRGYDVERIFMDAGSGINLIYAKTLQAMRISLEFLKPTDCSFHGIVPGSANYPLGRITLDVCFGNR